MKFGLSCAQIELICTTLNQAGVCKAVVFGSRAKGTWRNNSDIDLAVWGNKLNLGKLKDDLEELPMPYSFDVVQYTHITHAALREHIDNVGVVMFGG
ncbi:MAG: nucleotidyltransferase domain-containing protein [Oscillospiraceae bacterium]|nr:nucleotidyltransferase domain-containing protein [Oscillospiraceae bacterium]